MKLFFFSLNSWNIFAKVADSLPAHLERLRNARLMIKYDNKIVVSQLISSPVCLFSINTVHCFTTAVITFITWIVWVVGNDLVPGGLVSRSLFPRLYQLCRVKFITRHLRRPKWRMPRGPSIFGISRTWVSICAWLTTHKTTLCHILS